MVVVGDLEGTGGVLFVCLLVFCFSVCFCWVFLLFFLLFFFFLYSTIIIICNMFVWV